MVRLGLLTHYNKEAHEDSSERPHAEFERTPFLLQLAVLPPVAFRAVAAVPKLTIHAWATVAAWEVETLILVYATFAVRW